MAKKESNALYFRFFEANTPTPSQIQYQRE